MRTGARWVASTPRAHAHAFECTLHIMIAIKLDKGNSSIFHLSSLITLFLYCIIGNFIRKLFVSVQAVMRTPSEKIDNLETYMKKIIFLKVDFFFKSKC